MDARLQPAAPFDLKSYFRKDSPVRDVITGTETANKDTVGFG